MAKNMYQKREERKEANNNKETDNKININWDMPHIDNLTQTLIK